MCFSAATKLQVAPLVALSGHLGLVGLHPQAPRAPLVELLAATKLQVVPMVAHSGHVGQH